MRPRYEHESLLDWLFRWLEYRDCQRVVQAHLADINPECNYCSPFGHEPTCPVNQVHAELIAADGWESDAEMARRTR
jgi:hypothetical protein